MPIAELILDSSPTDIESFYFKATDQRTSLVVLVASKDQFKRLLTEVGGAPGLYILQAEDSTVYVGQSVSLDARLRNHKTTDKIGYRRVLVMIRDQGMARYLDYGEAKLYETLRLLGYRLEQTSLSGSLEQKRKRLSNMDTEHVVMADEHVHQFLSYSVALGLTKPVVRGPTAPAETPAPSSNAALAAPELAVTPPLEVPAPALSKRTNARGMLRVTLDSGETLSGAVATDTFVRAIEAAGVERVLALGLVLAGEPLVGESPSIKYPSASKPLSRYFVMTHSNTLTKQLMLNKVAKQLGLNWRVDVAPPV